MHRMVWVTRNRDVYMARLNNLISIKNYEHEMLIFISKN